jgi:hypothetical protein
MAKVLIIGASRGHGGMIYDSVVFLVEARL